MVSVLLPVTHTLLHTSLQNAFLQLILFCWYTSAGISHIYVITKTAWVKVHTHSYPLAVVGQLTCNYILRNHLQILSAAGIQPDLEVQAVLQLNYRYSEQFMIEQHFKSLVIPHLLDSIRIQWYHNGTAVDRSRTNSSLEQQGEKFTFSLAFINATEETDLGLYEVIADVDIYNFYASTGRSIYYLHYVEDYLNSYQLQVVSLPTVICQYGKLENQYA